MPLSLKIGFLIVLLALPSGALAQNQNCADVDDAGSVYRVCRFDPMKATIRVFNRDGEGQPLGGFDRLRAHLWQQHLILSFAVNGGMYGPGLGPVGLLIENGIQRRPAETADGWGNFYLKPNGVFFLKNDKAGILETSSFLSRSITPDFATQSGPMLVMDGTIHPRFMPDSDSLKIRNGVGVDSDGQVVFALSQNPVRFYDMARFFRDRLHAANALYLDGTISSQAEPMAGRMDHDYPLGPIIGVVEQRPN